MIYYGKGGWTWDDLYNEIPVFLRNFYMKEMLDAVKAEQEATKKIKTKVHRPDIKPPA